MTNFKNRLSKLEAERQPRKRNCPQYAILGTDSAIVDSVQMSLEEFAKLPEQPTKMIRLGMELSQI